MTEMLSCQPVDYGPDFMEVFRASILLKMLIVPAMLSGCMSQSSVPSAEIPPTPMTAQRAIPSLEIPSTPTTTPTDDFALPATLSIPATPTVTLSSPTSPVSASVDATPRPEIWQPPVYATWQWQLVGLPLDLSVDAQIYDIDLFDTDVSTVGALHSRGSRVICYISAGSWEDWRPDKDQFLPSLLGNEYADWPGERWLDIRQIDLLAPIIKKRLDLCKFKGFDGVEPDNIDAYTNDTGFPISYGDQLAYNIWLSNEAHARGLSIGLKNNPGQVTELLPYFEWALTEDCFDEGWCEDMSPFVQAGKAVFVAEYTDSGMTLDNLCPRAKALTFSAILKHRDLDAWRAACPE